MHDSCVSILDILFVEKTVNQGLIDHSPYIVAKIIPHFSYGYTHLAVRSVPPEENEGHNGK